MNIKLIVDDKEVFNGQANNPELWRELYEIRKNLIFHSHDYTSINFMKNVKDLCAHFGIDFKDFFSTRRQPIPYVKMLICCVMYFEFNFNKVQIAQFLRFDHSTVIHHIKTYNDRKGIYDEYKQDYLTALKILSQ